MSILESENLYVYGNGKSFKDVVAFYFEYEYDLLVITFFAVDFEFELVFNPISLPTSMKSDLKWNHLIPEKIYRQFQKLEQEKPANEIIKYQQKNEIILYEWFQNCWDSVTSNNRARIDSYFSIHDTYFKTDLNTGEKLNGAQIEKRYE